MAYQGDLYDDDDEETGNRCEGLNDSPTASISVQSADEPIAQSPNEMEQGAVIDVEEGAKFTSEEHEERAKARVVVDTYDDEEEEERKEQLNSAESAPIAQPQVGSGNNGPLPPPESISDKQQRQPIGEPKEQIQSEMERGAEFNVEEGAKLTSEGHEERVKARIGADTYDDEEEEERKEQLNRVGPTPMVQPQIGSGNKTPPSDDSSSISNRDGVDSEGDLESYSFLRPICIAIIAIVIVWVMRMFLPLIQAVAESSGMLRVMYLLMLALPVGVIVYAIWVAVRIFMSLPPGINCKFTDYNSDTDTKKALRDKLIKKYLSGFQRKDSLNRFVRMDAAARVDSLCAGSESDIDNWFKEYKAFQDVLKNNAGKVRTKYANAIALFTITSPKSQLDIIVTLFFSTRMVLTIARIFNKRMTKIGALRLTISWAMNLYLAGELQNIGAKVGGILGGCVGSLLKLVGASPFAKPAEQIVSTMVGLGVEGGVNKKLATLLGDKAIEEFVAVKGL